MPVFLADGSGTVWKRVRNGDRQDRDIGVLFSGEDGGPEAVYAIKPHNLVEPHYHLAAQFQVLVRGSMTFPHRTLSALAVHYTDHGVPYGPFTCSADCEMVVLHARQAGQRSMSEPDARRGVHRQGREIVALESDAAWPGVPEVRRRRLIETASGVAATLVRAEAGAAVPAGAGAYGRYELVLAGSALAGGKQLSPMALRFVSGDETPEALVAGSGGVTIGMFTFDADAAASYGGYATAHLDQQARGASAELGKG